MIAPKVAERNRLELAQKVAERIRFELAQIGMHEFKDFLLQTADEGTAYTVVKFPFLESISNESLSRLYDAAERFEPQWGLLICAFDGDLDKLVPVLEISGGGLSYISGGKRIVDLVRSLYTQKTGIGP
jgi:hypothetical protein